MMEHMRGKDYKSECAVNTPAFQVKTVVRDKR